MSRSSLCEARGKIDWRCFQFLLDELNRGFDFSNYLFKGHRVVAVDGCRIRLPATEDILQEFPLYTGHYPLTLMLTATDVFTGIPVAASLDHSRASERQMWLDLSEQIAPSTICLLDRGFDGARQMAAMVKRGLYFVLRLKAAGLGMPAQVKKFLQSGRASQVCEFSDPETKEMFKVRLLTIGRDKNKLPLLIATNLFEGYSRAEIKLLYLRRWKVETFYFRMKRLLQVQSFHARTLNGIKQEIWANLFLLGFTGSLIAVAQNLYGISEEIKAPNFKNAVFVVRQNLRWIVGARLNQQQAQARLAVMLDQIAKIVCLKQPGRKNPRISKQPYTTWAGGKKDKDIARYQRKYNKMHG